jgi:tetratricopeptide (TPR) repeat protein
MDHAPAQLAGRPRQAPSAGLAAALLLVAALAPQLPSWGYQFSSYDDHQCIVDLPAIRRHDVRSLLELFVPTPRPDLPEYMPLKNLSYAVDYALFGMSPSAFRPQQWLWYALCVWLLWRWLLRFLQQLTAAGALGLERDKVPWLAWLTALLFALHPVHVEAVTWLSGRKDVLSGAFSFAALLFALRWSGVRSGAPSALALALLFTGLALLSKPMAVTVPVLFVLQDLVQQQPRGWPALLRQRWPLYLGSSLLVALFVVAYAKQTGGLQPPISGGFEFRAYHGPAWLRWGQQLGAFLGMVVSPTELVPIYPPSIFDLAPVSLRGAGGLLLLTAAVPLTLVGLWKRHLLAFCSAAFVALLLPILLLPPWGQYVAARYLNVAVAFAILAIAWSLFWAYERIARLRGVALMLGLALSLLWTLSFIAYSRIWRDSYTLWSVAATTYPDFPELARQAGLAALLQERKPEAIGWLARCVELEPDNAECGSELAARIMDEQPERAEALLRRVLAADKTGRAHAHLAMLLARSGRAAEAAQLYGAWLGKHGGSYKQIVPLLGFALMANQPQLALEAGKRLVRAMSVEDPSGSAPVQMLLPIASALPDAALAAKLRGAAQACPRADCFRTAMGW